jgi:hypothetical protein
MDGWRENFYRRVGCLLVHHEQLRLGTKLSPTDQLPPLHYPITVRGHPPQASLSVSVATFADARFVSPRSTCVDMHPTAAAKYRTHIVIIAIIIGYPIIEMYRIITGITHLRLPLLRSLFKVFELCFDAFSVVASSTNPTGCKIRPISIDNSARSWKPARTSPL